MALADAPASSEPDSGGIRGEEMVATKPLLSAPSPSSATAAPAQESLEELDRRYAPYARRDAYGPMGLGPVGAAEVARLALERQPCSSRSGSWRASSWSSPTTLFAACARCGWRRSGRAARARGKGTRGWKGGGARWSCGAAARSPAP